MRVLVTGASGMVGSAVARSMASRHEVFATGRRTINVASPVRYTAHDFARDSLNDLLEWSSPELIVHCAAWTDLLMCESDRVGAYNANARSVMSLLNSARCRMILLSTDAVYPERSEPADETTARLPLNHYGLTKMTAEDFLLLHREATGIPHCIIRSTPVGFCRHHEKPNFLEWIVYSIRQGKAITLFKDAMFTPIDVLSLVAMIERLAHYDAPASQLNFASCEITSKYKFGKAFAEAAGLSTAFISEGSIRDFSNSVKRSGFQVLKSRIDLEDPIFQAPSLQKVIESCLENFRTEYEV